MPDAILPGDLDPNCWTGSLIEKDGTFYLFYTGKSLPDRPDPKGDQKIMLATSADLIRFEKQPDVTFYADGEIYWNKTINGPLDPKLPIHNQRDESFRDPEVFWNPEHNEYWMLLHAREAESQKHCFGDYRSDDLLAWTPRRPLEISVPVHQSNIDCPDLFQLGSKWVLTFSGGPRYAIAEKSEGPYSNHRPADHNLFVPKTARDAQDRVLVAGTVRPEKGVADFTVTLDADSIFRLNFRRGGGQKTMQTFEISTAGNHIRLGTIQRHSDNTRPVNDRVHQVPVGRPIRVRLFAVATILTAFIDDLGTLTMNAVSRENSQLIAEAFRGTVTIHDFTLRQPADLDQREHGNPNRKRGNLEISANHDVPLADASGYDRGAAAEGARDILFIAVDDLNTWSKLYDASFPIEMPNLERLAARGCFFERAYCTTPACGPSRAAVMSGLRATTTGMYNNPDRLEDHHRDTVFLPQWFQAHGYRTWGVGKILHGEPLHAGDPSRPIRQDFTRKTVIYPENKLNGPTGKGPGKNRVFDWGLMEGRLGDDTTIDLAVEKMRQQPDGKPVFQAVGIFSPHLPHYARTEHFARYPIQSLTAAPRPADDYDDIPPIARETVLYQRYFNQQLFDAHSAGDPRPLHKLIQSYQAAATYADEMLGRLLDELDASGRADETIIVLWSDHGYHLGDKESVIKFSLWERANHVPLIIVAPGVTTPGSRCDETVSLVDLYPTLVELAGLPPKRGLDGQSLVPLLKDPRADRAEPAITTWLEGNHAVRSKDWRNIRYRDGSEEPYRDGDLWNHENLAARPESLAALKRLRCWLPEEATQ